MYTYTDLILRKYTKIDIISAEISRSTSPFFKTKLDLLLVKIIKQKKKKEQVR